MPDLISVVRDSEPFRVEMASWSANDLHYMHCFACAQNAMAKAKYFRENATWMPSVQVNMNMNFNVLDFINILGQ